MACDVQFPKPGKLYAETELRNAVDGQCGIDTSNTQSQQNIDIQNLGGSPKDVFVQVHSVHQHVEFKENNSDKICYGVPVSPGHSENINLMIDQNAPTQDPTDTLRMEFAYRSQQLRQKQIYGESFADVPNSNTLNSSKTLTPTVDLKDP